ncbi:MAG: hypothetical protein ACLFRJ_03685 [Ectothiorhodospira sp.]
MSGTLQLTGELVQKLQEVLVAHDERCHDPLVAVQYTAAVTGYLLAAQPVPEEKRPEFLDHLDAFMRQVHADLRAQQASASPGPDDAGKVWRPGDT